MNRAFMAEPMKQALPLPCSYIDDELARNAMNALPSDYKIVLPSEVLGSDNKTFSNVSCMVDQSLFVVLDALRNNLREWDITANDSIVNYRPLYDLVEIFSRDSNGDIKSVTAAKIFDFDTGFFFVPLTFPANEGVVTILGYLSADERVGFLAELVRVFRNLVCFVSNVEGLHRDVVRLLGEFVGLLRLACGYDGDDDTDCAGNDSNDSQLHCQSLNVGGDVA